MIWGAIKRKSTSLFSKNKNKLKGMRFEERVERMLNKRLCFNVKKNVILKDGHGNISEIDLMYGIFFKTYVECKCYDSTPVPLKDVAKFKEVLALNNISSRRGLFITNNTYVPRAVTIGIKTIDGDQLKKMEKRAPLVAISKSIFILTGFVFGLGCLDIIIKHYQKNFEEGRRRRENPF
ncbi:hypothetical protein DICPUDRAFT_83762 [Dictyostelium purpureum]|uniref:Restriction endonuclease type IV Mrr domain-containing protein n=1 Tax=Dictyostelium purpureum TaxID=5786 RepID=F1A0J4_DICPU|nr:uncharacterized protein DICPUDRAFT_83762 [Dictyostelium purpureum]EGC30287.1 hypothetical protein DICPUDRAFT_83762 [Dictyostelium purpureum]|eukprot:XP_003293190.1 hypothetical protein DICPUDRAFT_83762 [Dictyostelium purpureum]